MKTTMLLLYAAIALVATGCISLKSEYQPTNYYRLVQKPSSIRTIDTLPGTLYIRTFTASEEFNNDHIVYTMGRGQQVDFYVYHRWISEMPDMLTDYVANRYIQNNIFRKGVAQSGSALVPDYILEGKVLEMIADNSDSSGVVLKLQVTVIGIEPLQAERPVILQKVYEHRVARGNTDAASIPAAYSEALATVADQMLVDIANAVRYHNANTPKGATVDLTD